jgi:hypothetical protein
MQMTEPDLASTLLPGDQALKNSHNRMITGIGTPSSHNRIPRPIVSSTFSCRKDNAGEKCLFLYVSGISDSESPILNSE